MKKIFLPFALFIVFNLFSQHNNQSSSNNDYNTSFIGNTSKNGMWIPSRIEDKTITGSPYLFNSWNGMFSVINKVGDKFSLINLNYNIQTKTLESKISNDSVFQYDLNAIEYVVIAKDKYKIINGEMLLELLSNSKIEFFKAYNVIIQEATNNPLTQTDLTPRRYVVKSEYKILQDEILKEFKLSKKFIVNLFPEKKNLILKYVENNNLSFNSSIGVPSVQITAFIAPLSLI